VIFLSRASFFVVVVFLRPSRFVDRINMHQEATRPPLVVPWGVVEVETGKFFHPLIFYENNISI
jgi:hypothetical protein